MSLSALTAEEAHTCRTMRPYCGHGFTKWLPEVYRVDLDSWETLKGGFHYRFSLTIKIKYDFFQLFTVVIIEKVHKKSVSQTRPIINFGRR